jgi:histidine ammonia-lyase
MQNIIISDCLVTWEDIATVADGASLELSDQVWQRISESRQAVLDMSNSDTPHYGVNTGLGALCEVALNEHQLSQLSYHTLMSHAVGVGEPLDKRSVRAIMACAIVNYSHGYSGISDTVVQRLMDFIRHDIIPVVPKQGSVGYLSHMAHIGLSLIGAVDVNYQGEIRTTTVLLDELGLAPLKLGAKDGLSLVNGTPAMTGLACIAIHDAGRLAEWADVIAAMSFEAQGGQIEAFDDRVIRLKKSIGVQATANNLRTYLQDSEQIIKSKGIRVQDALSMRSIPQVHGICRDQLRHAAEQVNNEVNSATDNPLVIKTGTGYQIVSQANPHGESVAMACDMLAIAVSEWTGISERRCYRLITPQTSGLPAFLIADSGVKSGFMIAQYTAAALASENKRLAVPAVIDNFITSGLQEDHVSFGDNAAIKLNTAIRNAFYVLAIEYLSAAQAFEFIDYKFGNTTEVAYRWLRKHVDVYQENHPLAKDIETTCSLIRQHVLFEQANNDATAYSSQH